VALFELRDVRKVYGSGEHTTAALDGVSLDIEEGEFVAIVGQSGSGKSTLLQVLGCLDIPTSGSVRVGGQEVGRASGDELSRVRNEKIGFVFQAFNLLPRLTLLENVALPLVYAGRPARERCERAAAALESVGLGNRLKSRPVQLSGGQMQRVAIARALVNQPRAVFADEPTGALDSRTAGAVLELFAQLNDKGRAVVLVTHDEGVARRARRRIEIRDGRIVP
jgi:putative ABC transport system ATP-binding protein